VDLENPVLLVILRAFVLVRSGDGGEGEGKPSFLGESVGANDGGDEGEENGEAQSKLMPRGPSHRGDRVDKICRRID